jgi:predicted permease
VNTILSDLRYAFRTLRRSRGFSLAVILTLALGIGGNTAMFSLVRARLLKPLPYRDPARLIVAWDTYLQDDKALPKNSKMGASPAELAIWSRQSDIFDETAWYRYVPYQTYVQTPGGEAVSVQAGFLSPDLLRVIGVSPALGSAFGSKVSPNSALLSDRLWRKSFGGDPGIAGRTIRLGGNGFTVTGVMPAGFNLPEWADLWLPPGPLMGDELTNPVRHAAAFIGRLKPGASARQAMSRLQSLSSRLAAENPKTSTGWGMRVSNLQDDLTAAIRMPLLLLMGAVVLVLLIACANIANLMLARTATRAKEIAVRAALGASPWRIARQLLAESLLLSLAGGALGLALAEAALKLFSPADAPLDISVLGFLLAISFLTGLAFWLAPAVLAAGSDPSARIKTASFAAAGSPRLRAALVVAEFALAMALVSGSGLLVKSLIRLMQVDPGIKTAQVLTLRVSYAPSRDPAALFRLLQSRVRSIPGVDSFASTTALPLSPSHGNAGRFNVPGNPLINPDSLPAAQLRFVSPTYFDVMRMPIRNGRAFTQEDLKQPVVIVNEAMARRFWPNRNPVGTRFVTGPWGPNPSWSTIVGVAANVKQFGLDSEPTFDIYFPALFPAYLAIHTSGDAAALGGIAQREIRGADPELAISDVRTMNQVLDQSVEPRQETATILTGFALLGILLAVVGIYGVVSWSVAERTKEIGIRMALGAASGDVLRMALGQGLALCIAGIAIGAAGTFALRRLLDAMLFGIGSADPPVYLAVTVLMTLVALSACYLPARRASRVQPAVALRRD